MDKNREQWKHQEDAIKTFVTNKHGILEMATGTGKTYTAIKIISKLLDDNKIERIIIITYGNDLLQQWYQELLTSIRDVKIFRFFDRYREIQRFILSRGKSILILSRDARRIKECLLELERQEGIEQARKKTMLLFDEIHGLGAPELRKNLNGCLRNYLYRLGLSATPERDYDNEGNQFIKDEIGKVIYQFGLKEAIEKGILCPFTYIPIFYKLTEDERGKKKKIISAYNANKKRGFDVVESDLYRDLARVNKTATQKIPLFENMIINNPELLHNCILFVETKEYGLALQKMIIRYASRFHTYYSEDSKDNLKKFGEGDIDCLITCKKISEGIDIRSVKNIVLFSSDKGKIVTIQRIGRSLRKNPEDLHKVACVIDFIYENSSQEDVTTDRERMEWLSMLAKVREKNEII